MKTFPLTVETKSLEAKHPEVVKYATLLDDLQLLYRGGKDLKDNGPRFLVKHSKELGSSYMSRLNRLTYDNVLGTVCSFYTSKLFSTELEIAIKAGVADALPSAENDFYAEFLEDCDNGETSLHEFFERAAIDVLVFSKSFFLIDLPKLATQPTSLYEQQAAGGLDPYLCYVDPCSVINWQTDAFGKYEWAVIQTINTVQEFLQEPQTVERFTYYDKTQYAVYECRYPAGKSRPTQATLVDSGVHAMSAQNEVPLKCIKTDHKLWLGNRLYLGLLDYLNASNSLSNSIFLVNNPIPVFTSGDDPIDTNQTAAEYAAIVLPKSASFNFVSPDGVAYDASQKYLEVLREGLYRQAHIVQQGRSGRASASVQSALSKEQDSSVSAVILSVFGTLIRTTIQETLQTVSVIRGTSVQIDCRGMNFSEDTASSTVELVLAVKTLNIPSPLFNRELNKKVARSLFPDANADTIQGIVDEIEAAPDAEQTTIIPASVTERSQI